MSRSEPPAPNSRRGFVNWLLGTSAGAFALSVLESVTRRSSSDRTNVAGRADGDIVVIGVADRIASGHICLVLTEFKTLPRRTAQVRCRRIKVPDAVNPHFNGAGRTVLLEVILVHVPLPVACAASLRRAPRPR